MEFKLKKKGLKKIKNHLVIFVEQFPLEKFFCGKIPKKKLIYFTINRLVILINQLILVFQCKKYNFYYNFLSHGVEFTEVSKTASKSASIIMYAKTEAKGKNSN